MIKATVTAPPTEEIEEPTRWGLRRRELRMLGIVVSIKALLFLFAGQSYQVLQDQRIVGLRGWLDIWNRWDAVNYQKLAHIQRHWELRPLLVIPSLVGDWSRSDHDYLVSAFCSLPWRPGTAIVLLRLAELTTQKSWPSARFGSCSYFHQLFPSHRLHRKPVSCSRSVPSIPQGSNDVAGGNLRRPHLPDAGERFGTAAGVSHGGCSSILDHAPLALAMALDCGR